LDKMTGNLGCKRKKATVTYHGNPLYLRIVISDKPEMSQQAGEVLPAGEGLRIQHQSMKLAILLNVGVDFLGQLLKICRFKRSARLQDKDPILAQQFMADHGCLRIRGHGDARRKSNPGSSFVTPTIRKCNVSVSLLASSASKMPPLSGSMASTLPSTV
jgi:hypothetical protein